MKKNLKKILFSNSKKLVLFFFFIFTNEVCMAKAKVLSAKNIEEQKVLCDQVSYSENYEEEVSYESFIEDCKGLVYLLESAYAGYEDMCSKGFNSELFITECENRFSDVDVIGVSEIAEFYYSYLINYINDAHCSIQSAYFNKNFLNSKTIFFSDVYVEDNGGNFFIRKPDNLGIPLNTNIDINEKYLFKYPSEGINVYRIGKLTDNTTDEVTVTLKVNNKSNELQCKKNNSYINKKYLDDLTRYNEIETEKTGYISIKTFNDFPKDTLYRKKLDKIYNDFAYAGAKFRNKEFVILDLRGNGGGNSLHSSKFLNYLITDQEVKSIGNFSSILLFSPAIYQVLQTQLQTTYSQKDKTYSIYKKLMGLCKKRKRLQILYDPRNDRKKIKSMFKGKLIIIIDKQTASSAELIIAHAKELLDKNNQIILVGENSLGCTNYGNIFSYQLRNSGISFRLAQFKMENLGITEGVGLIPDYWATNEDLITALQKITNDEELEKITNIINNNL